MRLRRFSLISSHKHSVLLLFATFCDKLWISVAKALFAYAADVSVKEGCNGVLVFKAKTSELVNYYIREFGARHAGAYDPFRLILWEDAAKELLDFFEKEV